MINTASRKAKMMNSMDSSKQDQSNEAGLQALPSLPHVRAALSFKR